MGMKKRVLFEIEFIKLPICSDECNKMGFPFVILEGIENYDVVDLYEFTPLTFIRVIETLSTY